MGKLRTEPKVKSLGANRFREIAEILREAQNQAMDSYVFWDLEEHENSVDVKKDFLYVAQKKGSVSLSGTPVRAARFNSISWSLK